MNRTSKDSLFGEQLWTKLPNRKKKKKIQQQSRDMLNSHALIRSS